MILEQKGLVKISILFLTAMDIEDNAYMGVPGGSRCVKREDQSANQAGKGTLCDKRKAGT